MIGNVLTQRMDDNVSRRRSSQPLRNTANSILTHSTSHDGLYRYTLGDSNPHNTTPTINNRNTIFRNKIRIQRPASSSSSSPHTCYQNNNFNSSHCIQSSTSTSISPIKSPYSPKSPKLKFTSTFTPNTFILIILSTFLFISTCQANIYIDERMIEVPVEIPDLFQSTLAKLARSGTILIDQSPYSNPYQPSIDVPIPVAETNTDNLELDPELHRREPEPETNDASSSATPATATKLITSTATITPPKASSTVSASSTAADSSTSSSSGIVAASASASALPQPFDSGFSSNISSSCSSFMSKFLANETFKSCLPFSLLLQNSNSFFQASKSVFGITQTLDAACSAPLTTCTSLMTSIASNLTSTTTCASDLTAQNPIVTQARLGLLAYSTLYTASCLRDPSTSAYCYAQAVTNSSSPTDTYIYYLPLNVSLPGGSQPTCNTCLKNTMQVFEAATSDRRKAIAQTYEQASSMVNVQCGPAFTNSSLAAATVVQGTGNSGRGGPVGGVVGVWLLVWVLVWGLW